MLELEDALVVFGGELKALGDGKFGGYLVLFGDEKKTDQSDKRDYFTGETEFGSHTTTAMYYNHGMDPTMKRRVLCEDAALKKDDVGVWIEGQLKMRDRYEKAVYGLIEQGKLGLSSGTAPHLVEREEKANGTHWIRKWPLGLDGSFAPAPAEPRTIAVALKSLPAVPSLEELVPELKAEENANVQNISTPEAQGQEGPVEGKTPDADAELKALTLNDISEHVRNTVTEAVLGPPKAGQGSGWITLYVFPASVVYEKPDGGGYFRRSYMIDANGKVTLGDDEVPVEQTWQPTKSLDIDIDALLSRGESTFENHSQAVLGAVKAWTERMRRIRALRAEREAKAGRVLSQANRDRIAAMVESMGPMVDGMQATMVDLQALLEETAEKPADGAEDAQKALNALRLRSLRRRAELRKQTAGSD